MSCIKNKQKYKQICDICCNCFTDLGPHSRFCLLPCNDYICILCLSNLTKENKDHIYNIPTNTKCPNKHCNQIIKSFKICK